MSERRFIELVNLYLDKEIADAELEELERELERNSYRQEVFNRYCQLQNASEAVSRHYGSHLADTVDLKQYEILARSSRKRVRTGFVASAGALAAACLTVAAALHFMESSLNYSELPPFTEEERHAASVSVEVFDAQHLAAKEEETLPLERAIPIEPPMQEAHSFNGSRSLSASFAAFHPAGYPAREQESPTAFEVPANFESAYRASTDRVVRSDSGFDASFSDFASFQFKR